MTKEKKLEIGKDYSFRYEPLSFFEDAKKILKLEPKKYYQELIRDGKIIDSISGDEISGAGRVIRVYLDRLIGEIDKYGQGLDLIGRLFSYSEGWEDFLKKKSFEVADTPKSLTFFKKFQDYERPDILIKGDGRTYCSGGLFAGDIVAPKISSKGDLSFDTKVDRFSVEDLYKKGYAILGIKKG